MDKKISNRAKIVVVFNKLDSLDCSNSVNEEDDNINDNNDSNANIKEMGELKFSELTH